MKKLLFIFVMLFPILAGAQTKQITNIFDKYEKRKNVESIVLSPSVLQLAASPKFNASTNDLLSKITEMRILNIKSNAYEGKTPLKALIRKELDPIVNGDKFSRVMKIQDGEDLLEMYVTKNQAGALIFITTTSDEFSVLAIFGTIDKNVVNAAMSGEIKVK